MITVYSDLVRDTDGVKLRGGLNVLITMSSIFHKQTPFCSFNHSFQSKQHLFMGTFTQQSPRFATENVDASMPGQQ